MISVNSFLLFLPALLLVEGPAKPQARDSVIVTEVSGVWLLNGEDPIGRSQVLHEGDVVVFKSRSNIGNTPQPAFVLFTDLNLKPFDSRLCLTEDHCDTTPFKAPMKSGPSQLANGLNWLQSIYAQVRPHVAPGEHNTSTISRGGLCRDGIGWSSNSATEIGDIDPEVPSTIKAFSEYSSSPVTLTVKYSDKHVEGTPPLTPGLYRISCKNEGEAQSYTWLVVVPSQGTEAVAQITRLRHEIETLSWIDYGWDKATTELISEQTIQDFIRDYLAAVAKGGVLH